MPPAPLRAARVAAQAYGRIDALVSNAVVNPTFGPMLDTPEAAMDKILAVNVKAGVLLAQAAAPHMPASAAILFVSSITAYQPEPPLAMYAVSKTALLGVVKAMARELGPAGVRVNGLAPGIVATKLSQALVSSDAARADQVRAARGLQSERCKAAARMCRASMNSCLEARQWARLFGVTSTRFELWPGCGALVQEGSYAGVAHCAGASWRGSRDCSRRGLSPV